MTKIQLVLIFFDLVPRNKRSRVLSVGADKVCQMIRLTVMRSGFVENGTCDGGDRERFSYQVLCGTIMIL